MTALAYAQHMYETPDEDLRADALERFIEEFRPTALQYAEAFDSCNEDALNAALADDLSITQGRQFTADDVSELLSDAYHFAWHVAGDYGQKRLSSLLGAAIHLHGKTSSDVLAGEIEAIANRIF